MTTSTKRPDVGELLRERLAQLEDGGCKKLTIAQVVGLIGFCELEATPTNESPAPQAAATPPTIGGKTAFERIHDRIADYLKSSDPATGITGFIFERFINVPPPIATQPAPQPPVEGLREVLVAAKKFIYGLRAYSDCFDLYEGVNGPKIMSTIDAALASPSLTAGPVAWRWRSIFNENSWCVAVDKPTIESDQYITEPLFALAAPATLIEQLGKK